MDHLPQLTEAVIRQHTSSRSNERGKAKYYHHAARWLGKAASAYRQAGRESEWRAYLCQLVDRHRRKYKLVPMPEALQ